MIGTYGDVVFIDAMLKEIGKEGALEGSFDYDLAWEAIRKDTFEEVPFESSVGKIGLKEYRLRGYVPSDIMYEVDGETRGPLGESVSRTLDFSFADFMVFRLVESNPGKYRVNDTEEQQLAKGAQSYKQVFDKDVGLMRPRKSDGSFQEDFDPFLW